MSPLLAPPTSDHRIGLVGQGIATSLSPALHAHEAAALGLTSYSYDLLDVDVLGVAPTDAGRLLREHAAGGWTGFNVTHPCKQVVVDALDDLTHDARALGAVNTVTVGRDGRLVGHNTDHSGFRAALDHGLPGAVLDRVVLVGAGGAGSAVAHALAAAGARRLVVVDADPRQAAAVARRVLAVHDGVEVQVGDDAAAVVPDADGVVNATPVGMDGHPGTPFDVAALHRGPWVADIVYRPVRTALLEAAEAAGCRTLAGTRMLVAQAADTFALLTGSTPDSVRMHAHLDDLLTARASDSRPTEETLR